MQHIIELPEEGEKGRRILEIRLKTSLTGERKYSLNLRSFFAESHKNKPKEEHGTNIQQIVKNCTNKKYKKQKGKSRNESVWSCGRGIDRSFSLKFIKKNISGRRVNSYQLDVGRDNVLPRKQVSKRGRKNIKDKRRKEGRGLGLEMVLKKRVSNTEITHVGLSQRAT